jgi:hypothetical protein
MEANMAEPHYTRRGRALAILKDARVLVADPKTWTHGAMARDKDGYGTLVRSSHSVCFCALGALNRVGGDDTAAIGTATHHLMNVTERLYGTRSVVNINDGVVPTPHGDGRLAVLAAIDDTISNAEIW